MRILIGLLCGLGFGFGLVESMLWDPRTILGYVDFAHWDPTLPIAMAAAVGVHMTALAWLQRRARPLLAERFDLPTRRVVDWRLVLGASIFGVGWGLGGVCPVPAFVRLGAGAADSWVFVPAMLAGFGLFALVERIRSVHRLASG